MLELASFIQIEMRLGTFHCAFLAIIRKSHFILDPP